jgi:hypothetical protein
MVGVYVKWLLPMKLSHSSIRRCQYAFRLGIYNLVFAIRFVPDRDDLDAMLGGHHAGAQLSASLMSETISDTKGIL